MYPTALSKDHKELLRAIQNKYGISFSQTKSIKLLSNSYKLSKDKSSIIGLNLDHNLLKSIPSEIYDIDTLVELSLRNCGIETISHSITKLFNLEKINLRTNKLQEIPFYLFKLKKLKYLNLSSNNIKILPEQILSFNEKIYWEKNWNLLEKNEKGMFLEDNPIICPDKKMLIKYESNGAPADIKKELVSFFKIKEDSLTIKNRHCIINFTSHKDILSFIGNSKLKFELINLNPNFDIKKDVIDLYQYLGVKKEGVGTLFPIISIIINKEIYSIENLAMNNEEPFYSIIMSLSTIINKMKGKNINLVIFGNNNFEIPNYLKIINRKFYNKDIKNIHI